VLRGEPDVGEPYGDHARGGGRGAPGRRLERVGEEAKALGRDLDEERVAVGEVVAGRGVRDAEALREGADGDRGDPLLVDDLQRRVDERAAQVPVMIGANELASSSSHGVEA